MEHFSIKCHQDTLPYLIRSIPMELFRLTKQYLQGMTLDNTLSNHIIQTLDLIKFKQTNHVAIGKIITLIKMSEKLVIKEIQRQIKAQNYSIATLSFRGLQVFMDDRHRAFINKLLQEAWITFTRVIGQYVQSDKADAKGGVIPAGNMVTDALYKPFQRIVSTALNSVNFIQQEG